MEVYVLEKTNTALTMLGVVICLTALVAQAGDGFEAESAQSRTSGYGFFGFFIKDPLDLLVDHCWEAWLAYDRECGFTNHKTDRCQELRDFAEAVCAELSKEIKRREHLTD